MGRDRAEYVRRTLVILQFSWAGAPFPSYMHVYIVSFHLLCKSPFLETSSQTTYFLSSISVTCKQKRTQCTIGLFASARVSECVEHVVVLASL